MIKLLERIIIIVQGNTNHGIRNFYFEIMGFEIPSINFETLINEGLMFTGTRLNSINIVNVQIWGELPRSNFGVASRKADGAAQGGVETAKAPHRLLFGEATDCCSC